ncbi:uncharacterized protein KY384_000401 [Bacidia gigantensis]|uniref:uncharacterized protein n=1 Tax=Bacidia gigantensis TaxID=2732470 RepID=UPI001D04B8D8|nr:uncharacterized protein KY384_000401 [Bacidia gigantensis]KAG8525641.1 hypothetical protein KY384_000401 [Bacidia gigantensis]
MAKQCSTQPAEYQCKANSGMDNAGPELDSFGIDVSLNWRIDRQESKPAEVLNLILFRYNSMIFKAIASHDYNIYTVYEEFLEGTSMKFDGMDDEEPLSDGYVTYSSEKQLFEMMRASPQSYRPLSPQQCINQYSEKILSNKKDLLVIATHKQSNISRFPPDINVQLNISVESNSDVRYGQGTVAAANWMCSTSLDDYVKRYGFQTCDTSRLDAAHWRPFGFEANGCKSEHVAEKCRLEFSSTIGIIVVICNSIKAITMILTVSKCDKRTLCTLGDAITSFLTLPDSLNDEKGLTGYPQTSGCAAVCSKVTKSDITNYQGSQYWLRMASPRRFIILIIICVPMLAAVSALFALSLSGLKARNSPTDISSLWTLGFGQVSADSLILSNEFLENSHSNRLLGFVLLANLPQGMLSILYLLYNSILTCMLMEKEYQSYARERKPLRVSNPVQGQKATYYLQLPFRYAIPLIILSGVMHWLISQAFFIAHIVAYDSLGERDLYSDIITCGYSPIGIIFTLILGVLMLACLAIISFRKIELVMPVAKNRSFAIRDACHRLSNDTNAANLPIMWGIIHDEDGVEHHTFSSLDVKQPLNVLMTV